MIKLPLRTGPEIDWRTQCHPGDNQGETDACSVFAIANWAECMLGAAISNEEAIDVWRAERQMRYGNLSGGLTITEAFAGAMIRGKWMPQGTTLRRVSNIESLPLAPLVAGIVNIDWQAASSTGMLSKTQSGTHHASLIAGHMRGMIIIENSHGPEWGQSGFAVMPEPLFPRHCNQLWQIILPGAPATLSEQAAQAAGRLSEQIGDQVKSIGRNLETLGYSLPGDGRLIMADIIQRSMTGQLTSDQERAKSNLADVYLLLMGSGITDEQINAVWELIK